MIALHFLNKLIDFHFYLNIIIIFLFTRYILLLCVIEVVFFYSLIYY